MCADTARAHASRENLHQLTDFNWEWFTAWRSTKVYARWCRYSDIVLERYKMRPCDLERHKQHVCSGGMQVADVGRRFRQFTTTQLGLLATLSAPPLLLVRL